MTAKTRARGVLRAMRKLLPACAAALACLSAAGGDAPAKPAAWPTFRGDPAQTGNAASPLASDLKLLWTHEAKELIASTAAIQGGAVYIGTDKGRLLALDLASGKLKWQYKAKGAIEAAPGIRDGKVFVGDVVGVFHAVNAETGAGLWTYEAGGKIVSSANFAARSEPGNGAKGANVLFGSWDNNLYCLSAETGKLVWSFKTDYMVHGSPCIVPQWPPDPSGVQRPAAPGGTAIIAGCDAQLRVLDLAKGTQRCSLVLSPNVDVASSPAFDNGRIYVSTYDEDQPRMVCVELQPAAASGGPETLRKAWDIVTGKQLGFYASPAVAKDRVIFAGLDGLVRCLAKADGKELWKFRTDGEVNSSPVIAGPPVIDSKKDSAAIEGERVFFGSGDGTLYAVSLSEGRKVWSFAAGAPIRSSPAVGEGRLVIAATDGAVYCFGPAKNEKP